MVFDRNAINTGRRIQDFGLCDLQGNYQNSAKMRAKGFLAVAFLEATDPNSQSMARDLQNWTALGEKLTVAAVVFGEREDVEKMAQAGSLTYPVLWDFEMYVAPIWSVSAVPTLFLVDSQGLVLGRVLGADEDELAAAQSTLAEVIHKSDEAAKAAAEAKAAADAEAATKSANQAPQVGGAPSPVSPAPSPTASPSVTAPAKS